MPELLRLQTPKFELSVWASDISARAKTYRNTMTKRSGTAHVSAPEVRFAPSARLDTANALNKNLLNDEQTSANLTFTEPSDGMVAGIQPPHAHAKITLNSPLFFENTQYQFEWVFFHPTTYACLAHRSQTVNDGFRFAEKRGPIPARLTGTINTGNDVGWMRLPLTFEVKGKTHTQNIAFEVLPTKMALHQDLPAMYQAIDAVYPLWRFSLVEKTEQDAASSKQRGHFPLMWLANFADLRARFEQGLKVICAAPHSRLQPTAVNIKAAKLTGRLPHKLGEKVKQDFANGQYDQRYRVDKKNLSVDTPENRFIKMAVTQCKRQLSEFEAKLRASNQAPDRQRLSDSFLNDLHSWQLPLQKVLNQSFLKEVSAYGGQNRESLVLQQKTGYSTVYRVWQELKFYLDVFGNQSSISMKSVADIYEVWCFLQIKDILETDLDFGPPTQRKPRFKQGLLGELKLENGNKGAFDFYRQPDGLKASLYHEPSYKRNGQKIRSFLLTQEPDIVLEVTLPNGQQFIWLFDAKYRIEDIKVSQDNAFVGKPAPKDMDEWSHANSEVEATGNHRIVDGVPDDAINQMHRYRDALIRLSSPDTAKDVGSSKRLKKSRPVFGAFALYPGFFDQPNESNPYNNAIGEIGIGAFALLPSDKKNEGRLWLAQFLADQIGNGIDTPYSKDSLHDHLYIRDSARIPQYGLKQVLHTDLVLFARIGNDRSAQYINSYYDGSAKYYHIPEDTLNIKYASSVIGELQYLAVAVFDKASTHATIFHIWPIRSVKNQLRSELIEDQTGTALPSTDKKVWLFELGAPLKLKHDIHEIPLTNFRDSLKLASLSQIEGRSNFSDIMGVYEEALSTTVK